MKSDLPTALHPLAGRPLLRFVVDAARALEPLQLTVVVDFGGDRVRQKMGEGVTYASQGQPLGTGHALLQAEQAVAGQAASVLVLYGNRPLIRPETLRRVLDRRESEDAAITLLTCSLPDATGIYCFRDEWLWPNLRQLQAGPGGKYDLADLVERAGAQGELVTTLQLDDGLEAMAVDDRLRLAQAEAEMRRRINERWMLAGVTLIHPEATFIEAEVEIGADTTIWPNSFLQGQTRIGSACTIGPGSVIRDSTIGDGCKVELSVVEQAIIEEGSEVGPFGHLRKGAHLARGVHMGNFGEVKNSYLGPGVKMGHFSYLGDATVGDRTNIGAGTITCNYDGQRKHRTLIGQEAFIGSDTMLVAPVEIGDGAMTGAGSVVTRDVPPGSVAFGVPARVQSTPTSSPPPGETVESEVD
jgi:bifunctional UDP-N-acetylglucosamine pyrophosphorylase/glucosamine-1-phosphate N-acetyltransferase